jgi:hypothetical protein
MAEPREQKCSTGPTGSRSRQASDAECTSLLAPFPQRTQTYQNTRQPRQTQCVGVPSGRNPPNHGRTINLAILNFRMSPAPPSAAQLPQCSRLASNNSVRHDEQYPRAVPSLCTAACGISIVLPQCGQFAWSSWMRWGNEEVEAWAVGSVCKAAPPGMLLPGFIRPRICCVNVTAPNMCRKTCGNRPGSTCVPA